MQPYVSHICLQERDGTAFLVRSINNQFVGISRLNDAYTDTAGLTSVAPRVSSWPENELPLSEPLLQCCHLSTAAACDRLGCLT